MTYSEREHEFTFANKMMMMSSIQYLTKRCGEEEDMFVYVCVVCNFFSRFFV